MNQLNNHLNRNNSELQNTDQTDNPVSDHDQKLNLETFKNHSDWDMTPAELYGCLCHKRER
jgi:hypothetical protein